MEQVIGPQKLALKRAAFATSTVITCPVSNTPITWDEASVDHDAPWPLSRIIAEWPRLSTVETLDRGFYREFTPDDARDFLAFHDARARLRVVSKAVNSANAHNRPYPEKN